MNYRIRYGFCPNGDFVAVDEITHASAVGSGTSIYANKAHHDQEATARDMIVTALRDSDKYHDAPHPNDAQWEQNYSALDLRLGSCAPRTYPIIPQMEAIDSELQAIIDNPADSFWLKDAICALLKRDPVDAARDAAKLADVFSTRSRQILRRA